jgi:threonine dehydrogenase-like Zn-dependent dehydrogenase
MSPTPARPATSRRVFLGDLSRTAADASLGSLVAGTGLRNVHAAGEDEIRVAVIGCGGRGTGATVDALSVPRANLKVVAMADVFPERLSIKKQSLAMEQPEPNPYRREWEDLVAAIVDDTPYNEAARGAEASLVTAMGRMAAHVGRTVTFGENRGREPISAQGRIDHRRKNQKSAPVPDFSRALAGNGVRRLVDGKW